MNAIKFFGRWVIAFGVGMVLLGAGVAWSGLTMTVGQALIVASVYGAGYAVGSWGKP